MVKHIQGRGTNRMAIIFDADDINYLVRHFSAIEFRQEKHWAEIQVAVCRNYGEDDWEAVWEDYGKACELAIDIILSDEPKIYTVNRRYNRIDAKKIKEQIDIVAVAERYTHLIKSGKNFKGLCPIHEEKHPSFYIYPEERAFHCYGCGTHGDVIALVMKVEHIDYKTTIAKLGGF
jgi:hypothetical protein